MLQLRTAYGSGPLEEFNVYISSAAITASLTKDRLTSMRIVAT